MNTKIKIILNAFIVFSLVIAAWAVAVALSKLPETPATNVKPFSAGYVQGKIYVVSANPRYGYHPGASGVTSNRELVKKGEPCFIINVTVRNDYSEEQPPPEAIGVRDASSSRGLV